MVSVALAGEEEEEDSCGGETKALGEVAAVDRRKESSGSGGAMGISPAWRGSRFEPWWRSCAKMEV